MSHTADPLYPAPTPSPAPEPSLPAPSAPSTAPSTAPRLRGRVRLVRETFGFLIDERGTDRFFHRNHTHYADSTLIPQDSPMSLVVFPGLTVEFMPVLHTKGPRALFVRLLDTQ